MQIELTDANQKLVEDYRKKMKGKLPDYDASSTTIINTAASVWLTNEIRKNKK